MNSGILSTIELLVVQDLWLPKDARKSVKAKKVELGPRHLATMGTEVARMRKSGAKFRLPSWRANDGTTCVLVPLNICSHMSPYY